jgi:endonuclease-3
MREEKRMAEVLKRLAQEYGGMKIALRYQNPLQLLIATILAAQCTDERVNAVTEGLFRKYPDAQSFAQVSPSQLEEDIRPTGFFRQKARAIIAACSKLVESYGGEVPSRLEDLVSLPGVGRKTANILLGNAFGQPAIAVDTHVLRVSRRLGLASAADPDKVEAELRQVIPREQWTEAAHWMVWHGRRVCRAQRPLCHLCPVYELCPWEEKRSKKAAE